MKNLVTVLVGMVVVFMLLTLSAFTVDQREYALVIRLGQIVKVEKSPGLYFKLPLVDEVKFYEKRIFTLDKDDAERFNTAENKYMLVDSFVKWRIIDPIKYYVSVRGDEVSAERRLSQNVNNGLRAEFGRRTIHDVIAGERAQIMDILRAKANAEAGPMGIEVVDVRLKRVDYTDEISGSVYQRMEAERKRVANELRSQGFAASEKIRADADKQREVIIAEAYRDAQQTKGEGDAKAAEIYSAAYSKNPEFYAFYRSTEAYRNSFKSKSDVMVLDSSSDFLKYMRSSGGKSAPSVKK